MSDLEWRDRVSAHEARERAQQQEEIADAMYLVQVSTSRTTDPAKIVMPMSALLAMIQAEMETPNTFGTVGAPHYFQIERIDWRK